MDELMIADPRPVWLGALIPVLHPLERGEDFGLHSGFFTHLANSRRLRRLPLVHQPLG